MKMLIKYSFKLYTYVLMALAFGACKREETIQLSTKNEVVLTGEMLTINPHLSNDNDSYTIHIEVWQCLNAMHPKTLQLIPVLASLPVLSEDKLTYTYVMDNRARWSDDRPVTTEDVIYTFKSIINQTAGANTARSSFLDLDSVWSPKAGTVAFHFSKIKFNRDYDIEGIFILPKHRLDTTNVTDKITWSELHAQKPDAKVQKAGDEFSGTEKSIDIHQFIGSGPYIFEEWKRGERIILRKNNHYWAQQIPWLEAYPDRLIYTAFWNGNTKIVALKAQELDLTGIGPNQYLRGFDSARYNFIRKDSVYDGSFHYIAWNNENPIFASKKVRRALTMLVNREAIIHLLLHNLARKAEGPITSAVPGWDPSIKQPVYDPAKAKQLLAEDGWRDFDGDGTLNKIINGVRVPFKFTFMAEDKDPVLLIVAEDLRKVGIEVTLTILEYSVILQNLRNRSYAAYMGSNSIDPVERDFFDEYHSSQAHEGGENFCCYANSEVDKLIDTLKNEFDRNKRMQLSRQIQRIIIDDAPMTYLFSNPQKFAWVDRFDNVQLLPFAPYIDPRFLIVRGSGVRKIDYP